MSRTRSLASAKVVAPQATLANIRRFVDACYEVERVPSLKIADVSQLSARHVGYAAQAAELLGFVERAGRQSSLSPSGKRLALSEKHSEEEKKLLFSGAKNSRALQTVAPGLFSRKPPTLQRLSDHLTEMTGLGATTAAHRAAMLLKWRDQLLQSEIRFKDLPMWRQIEIKNFRSIEGANVSLAPFTVVVGRNGSGKSNFVDALVLIKDVATDASTAISARGGISGVRRWTKKRPTDVTIDVRAGRRQSELSEPVARHLIKLHSGREGAWSFSQEVIKARGQGKNAQVVSRKNGKIDGPPGLGSEPQPTASVMVTAKQLKAFAPIAALHKVYRYRLNPDLMRTLQVASDQTRLSESGDNIATAIRGMKDRERQSAIVAPMSKIIPGLLDVCAEQLGRHLNLKFKQEQGSEVAEFNATEMSDGALRALGIVVATHQMEEDELLIIEEPEVSIHVGAAQLLFELLKEASERGAVLITTHSADLLDAARDEEILVCDYVNGSTKIGPLADAQRQVVRQGLFSVAELMRSEPLRIQEQ